MVFMGLLYAAIHRGPQAMAMAMRWLVSRTRTCILCCSARAHELIMQQMQQSLQQQHQHPMQNWWLRWVDVRLRWGSLYVPLNRRVRLMVLAGGPIKGVQGMGFVLGLWDRNQSFSSSINWLRCLILCCLLSVLPKLICSESSTKNKATETQNQLINCGRDKQS